MQLKYSQSRFLFVTIAIIIAAISRLLPHPPNFTPIAAMALFGGVYLSSPNPNSGRLAKLLAPFRAGGIAFILPLLAMFISDTLLELVSGTGFHNTIIYVYASFAAITLIGIYIRNNAKAGNIVLASLISSILFFLVTNFGVWASSGFKMGMNGLLNTYLIAIPFYSHSVFGSFFANTIIGDLFYCGILFGSLYFAKSKFTSSHFQTPSR